MASPPRPRRRRQSRQVHVSSFRARRTRRWISNRRAWPSARSSPASPARTDSYLAELLLEKGLRGLRPDAPPVRGELLADRTPARPRDADSRRPARPALAHPRARAGAAARALQPRGDVVRAGVVGPADADRRVQLAGRHARARGGPRGRSAIRIYQASSSEMFGKVREVPQTRDDAVLSAQPVRRLEGVRALHHGELPRELRPVRRLRHPVQPRVAAARPRVRDAQGHRRRRAHQARAGRRRCRSATSTRTATGASPATTCARCG